LFTKGNLTGLELNDCRFRSSQSEVWQTVRVVPRDSCSLTVHGLRPRTSYQFQLLARDQHGVPHFSRVVNAMTATLTNELSKTTDSHARLTFFGYLMIFLFTCLYRF